MKKYIFTESQIKKVLDTIISEQAGSGDVQAINNGSIEFLKMKGVQGRDLTEKIMKYQRSIGCDQTGHMLDCLDTMFNKFRKDFDLWKSLIQKNKPLMTKIGDWLAEKFGFENDPKSLF